MSREMAAKTKLVRTKTCRTVLNDTVKERMSGLDALCRSSYWITTCSALET